MADSGENRMNLAALQRVDPYIKSIVETASQVALYKFNAKANEWEKTEVEGTLFVYSRCANPLHGFIIMNRLNRDNLIEPLSCDMEFQRQDPFLLYRNAKLVIYGIWFYNKEDCCKIDLVMNRLTEAISRKTSNPDRQRRASESDTRVDPKSVDIISMLTKAQNEFNQVGIMKLPELNRKNTESKVNNNKGPGLRPSEPKVMTDNAINLVDLVRPKAIRVSSSSGPPPDVTSGTSVANDDNNNNTTSLTVAALFASAGRLKQTDATDSCLSSKSDAAKPVQKLTATTAAPTMMDWKPGNPVSLAASLAAATGSTTANAQVGINTLLQRLLSNPEHSVEHIERQQRGGNGLGDTIKSQIDNGINPPSLVSETEDILLKLQLHSVQANVPDAGNDIPLAGDGNWVNSMLERRLSTTDRKLLPPPVLTPAMIESGINLSPPLLSPMLGSSSSPVPPDLGMLALSSTPPRLNPMADVSLMSPMMFSNLKALSDNSVAPKRPADDEMPSLTPEITPLTRDQLSQALIYLLKNDTDFVTKLHEAYVNSLRDLTAANIKS